MPKTSKWRTNLSTQETPPDRHIDEENDRRLNEDMPTDKEHSFDNSDPPKTSTNDSPLYPGSEVTLLQCIVLILAFTLRHNLSSRAIEDLLKLITIILPPNTILPHTYHLLKKLIPTSDDITVHLFCKCGTTMPSQTASCEQCGETNDSLKQGDFFISLSIEKQIQNIFEKEIPNNEPPGNLLRETQYRKGDVSLLWNCDGVPVFNSSFNCLWPIRCVINELPAEVRFKHVLLAGIWFGRGKPEMTTFLNQFVQDIKKINLNGIIWKDPHTGNHNISRVFPIACTCDAVAKCLLQGIHQFNGSYGCGCCLNEGLVVAKGRGFTRVYDSVPAELRTHEQLIKCGEQAIDKQEHVFGVKTISPLILLNSYGFGFDIIKSFPIDYMHAVLLGVTKAFLDLWLNSKYHESPWYIGKSKHKIDQKLLSLTPPSDIPRVPRSVDSAPKWKAAECRSWLLFYSLPVLNSILPNIYLKHWLYLVNSIFLLLKDSVSEKDLTCASQNINKFVNQVKQLYGITHMSYNIHQLTHLEFSVRLHGPLWCNSAFSFEGHNQKLTKFCHGTQSVPQQIAFRFSLTQLIPILLDRSTTESHITHRINLMVNDWINGYPLRNRACTTFKNITLLGCPHHKQLNNIQQSLVTPVWGTEGTVAAQHYNRAIINGKVFTTETYGFSHKHNSYTVELKNGNIGKITSIISSEDKVPVFFVNLFNSKNAIFASETVGHLKCITATATTVAVKYTDIVRKVVFMKMEKFMYASLQPNGIEID